MQRQVLTLDTIPYLIEFRKASEFDIRHVDEFVMLRKYDIMNELAYDKEIMFIKTSDFKKLFSITEDKKISSENRELVFPYINQNYESFSSTIFDFLPNSTPQSLYYRISEDIDTDLKTDYYELLNKSEFELFFFEGILSARTLIIPSAPKNTITIKDALIKYVGAIVDIKLAAVSKAK